MIRHIVMWMFADGPDKAANVERARAGLAALDGVVPGLLRLEVVAPVDPLEHTHDLVLLADFASADDLARYAAHPAHVAVAGFIGGVRTSRACVDYAVDA